jgi:hypothetical protein
MTVLKVDMFCIMIKNQAEQKQQGKLTFKESTVASFKKNVIGIPGNLNATVGEDEEGYEC